MQPLKKLFTPTLEKVIKNIFGHSSNVKNVPMTSSPTCIMTQPHQMVIVFLNLFYSYSKIWFNLSYFVIQDLQK